MQRGAISRGNVDAISGNQEAPLVIYHSYSLHRCEQTRLRIKSHTKQWRFMGLKLESNF